MILLAYLCLFNIFFFLRISWWLENGINYIICWRCLCISASGFVAARHMGLMVLFPFWIISSNFWANFMKYFLPAHKHNSWLTVLKCLICSSYWSPQKNFFYFLVICYASVQNTPFHYFIINVSPFLKQVGSCITFPLVIPFIVSKISLHFQIIS